jgi:hypothetical protein
VESLALTELPPQAALRRLQITPSTHESSSESHWRRRRRRRLPVPFHGRLSSSAASPFHGRQQRRGSIVRLGGCRYNRRLRRCARSGSVVRRARSGPKGTTGWVGGREDDNNLDGVGGRWGRRLGVRPGGCLGREDIASIAEEALRPGRTEKGWKSRPGGRFAQGFTRSGRGGRLAAGLVAGRRGRRRGQSTIPS